MTPDPKHGHSADVIFAALVLLCFFLINCFRDARASAPLPRPPQFLATTTNAYEDASFRLFGVLLGEGSLREVPVLERYPRLRGCHRHLHEIMRVASNAISVRVIEGRRSLKKQKEYLKKGVTKTLDSYHLKRPCRALDVVFEKRDGSLVWEREQAIAVANYLTGIGHALGYCIRNGTAWSGDFDIAKNKFMDGFHIQLMDEGYCNE